MIHCIPLSSSSEYPVNLAKASLNAIVRPSGYPATKGIGDLSMASANR